MAEAVSDSEGQPVQPVKPPPKRRRILDPSAIVPVSIYSNKVSSSLQLQPMAPTFKEKETTDDCSLLKFSTKNSGDMIPSITLSDSEEEEEVKQEEKKKPQLEEACCPSPPPPPDSSVCWQSRRVKKKISEVDRELRAVTSLFSPEPQSKRTRRRRRPQSPSNEEDNDLIMIPPNDDDIILVTPDPSVHDSPYSSAEREIPLKIRCRTDVHKLPVQSSTPLSEVVRQLSVILNVPPPRLLLMKGEVELPTDATVSEVGLGIADIIECVVMAAEDRGQAAINGNFLTVRLQSKDKDSGQEFSLHRDDSLGSVFSQYLSSMAPSVSRSRVRFHFDGSSVSANQTPAELDMEDGDIIEVWT